MEVYGTGSELSPMTGCGICSFESLGSTTNVGSVLKCSYFFHLYMSVHLLSHIDTEHVQQNFHVLYFLTKIIYWSAQFTYSLLRIYVDISHLGSDEVFGFSIMVCQHT